MKRAPPAIVVASCLAACAAGSPAARAPSINTASSATRVPEDLAPLHEGSTVALRRAGERTIAYVADDDDHVVRAIALDDLREVGTTAVDGAPSQLVVLRDGRVVVLLRDRAKLRVLTPDGKGVLALGATVDTPIDPEAIAVSPDDRAIVVVGAYSHVLRTFDARDLAPRGDIDLPREPRAAAFDAAGRVFVTHAVGSSVSRVELASRVVDAVSLVAQPREARTPRIAPRPSCQGFAIARSADGARLFAPHVSVETAGTNDPSMANGYGSPQTNTELDGIAVVDTRSSIATAASLVFSIDDVFLQSRPACLLPRAAAFDAAGDRLYVTCLGVDQLIQYDASPDRESTARMRQWKVGAGATGVAIDAGGDRVVVWSQFEHAIAVIPTPRGTLEDTLVAARRVPVRSRVLPRVGTMSAKVLHGRALFHASGDERISSDGRACASCHPDGRDDGFTWSTPDGPRQTLTLAGRLHRGAPFGWTGASATVTEHIGKTFERLLGAGGLPPEDVDDLAAYLDALSLPPRSPEEAALVARGAAIFGSADAACATCHRPADFVDGQKHDLDGGPPAMNQFGEAIERAFETQSLCGVAASAPYFHDGRYATLRELLVKSDGKMGHTSQLAPGDLAALEAYLRSL